MLFHSADLIGWIKDYVMQVPLEWFVFSGSFLEEVVSPIPSMLITGIAGSLALMRHEDWRYLALLAILASSGKTIGAWLYYFFGDKGEDLLIGRVGRWFGVTHADVERVGARFTGHHWKDGGLLFLIRAVPFMPTTPFSVASGIFKMDIRVFLLATLSGYFVKDLGYVLAGYFGIAKLSTLWHDLRDVKWIFDDLVAIAIVISLYLLYRHRHHGRHVWQLVCRFFDRKRQ